MGKYSIGVDFGTLSGRALLIDLNSGAELATAVFEYPHGVIDSRMPDGRALPPDWALQHPQDYLDTLSHTVPAVISQAGVNIKDIIGIGIDFTACTIMPVKSDGTPLCFLNEYRNEPHTYVKLWKHHAAQDKANKLNEIASERGEPWLARYGGKVSSEWAVPKIWQVADEAPQVYDDADFFIEAADWVVWMLSGQQTRNACCAGYKALWSKADGYPSQDFYTALDPKLANLVSEKLNCPVSPIGDKAGNISTFGAELTGLDYSAAVAVGNIDAHVCAPAVKISTPGKLLAIMGTSTCHMLVGPEAKNVPGICGCVADGILPGLFGYEAGQSCVGDHFAWFVDNCLPKSYSDEAESRKINPHALLTGKAEKLRPGESGLVALDWWNGNRSVLVDVDLSGLMIGMTLATKPEEIYRALIEATAYGTRAIVENFRSNGVAVDEFYAAGGISRKNPFMMQLYSDVLNLPVYIAGSDQSGALGAAIFGAVAAGKEKSGFADISEASEKLGKLDTKVYTPNPDNVKTYDLLYAEYKTLHDCFGRGENDVMKRLRELRRRVIEV